MPSSPPPPPAGSGQEEVEMVSGEASLPLHAAETGAGGDGEAPSSSEEEADSSDDDEESDDMDEDEESSDSSDDSDMEDGEEEDQEEEEDTDSSSDYSQESDEEQLAADREEAGRIWKEMKKTKEEAAEGDGVHHRNPAVASCCVCMEPWTSDGAHRICCIPCGHVYGRSCLEKWLRRCGGTVAKCPQCGDTFEHKKIINLHGTEYLWNDCIHDQEQKRLVSQALDQLKETKETCLKTEKRTLAMQMMVVRIDKEMTEFRGEVASLMEKMTRMIISKGGDDTATPTRDGMLEFLSRNWPELPRSRWGHSSTLDT